MSETKKSFVARCKDYFGFKEGQKLQEFSAEIKALTDKDKADLTKWFNEAGLPTDAPLPVAQPKL